MSADEEFEAALWGALRVHRVTVPHADVFVADLLRLAHAYAASDAEVILEERRQVLFRDTEPVIHSPVDRAEDRRA